MSCRPSGRDSTTCSTITCDKEFHFLKKHLKVETTLQRKEPRNPQTQASRRPPPPTVCSAAGEEQAHAGLAPGRGTGR